MSDGQDHLLERARARWLAAARAAFSPAVPLHFLGAQLGFDSDAEACTSPNASDEVLCAMRLDPCIGQRVRRLRSVPFNRCLR